MLELARTRTDVVACLAEAEALDALERPRGALPIRVAPDELLLAGHPGSAHAFEHAAASLVERDEDAVVLDVTDGWTVWSLAGSEARDAFERLSMLRLPAVGLVQGDVARLPVKVVVDGDRLHLFVPSSWEAYLHDRIVGLELAIAEEGEPRAWAAPRRRAT